MSRFTTIVPAMLRARTLVFFRRLLGVEFRRAVPGREFLGMEFLGGLAFEPTFLSREFLGMYISVYIYVYDIYIYIYTYIYIY